LHKFLWISAKGSIARPQIIMLLLMRAVYFEDKEAETDSEQTQKPMASVESVCDAIDHGRRDSYFF
jgi:hypothetical protein